jgi:Holliday junction resolvasome RuvABC ATP-dependent DNA helicase subunit
MIDKIIDTMPKRMHEIVKCRAQRLKYWQDIFQANEVTVDIRLTLRLTRRLLCFSINFATVDGWHRILKKNIYIFSYLYYCQPSTVANLTIF